MGLHSAKKVRYDVLGPQLVKAFQKRHFDAYYCSSKEEALSQMLSLIPKGDVVSWGGSETLEELKAQETLKQRGYTCIDRDSAKTPEERVELMRQGLLCDTFLASSNAVTEDGILVNIDNLGNRVAAMTFGPKSVVMVVGMNKVCKTVEEAVSRTRNLASPTNTLKFEGKVTPCTKTGKCGNCLTDDCICNYLVTTRNCFPAGKIKVILVGEDLGF